MEDLKEFLDDTWHIWAIMLMIIFLFFFVSKEIDKERSIKSEIIKKSKNYTIYKDCTEIDDVYFCKNLIEDYFK